MSNYENLKLDNQLCFALYAATNAIIRSYRLRLSKVGLTYPQYLILVALWETNGITIKGLGDRLHLDSGTLTPILKRLESVGILSRERNKNDERVVNIRLTKTGKDLEHQVAKIQSAVACETGLEQLEFVKLRTALHELAATMIEKQHDSKTAA